MTATEKVDPDAGWTTGDPSIPDTVENWKLCYAGKGGEPGFVIPARFAKPHQFPMIGCSQCGREFGPGNRGYSHCEDHAGFKAGHPLSEPLT